MRNDSWKLKYGDKGVKLQKRNGNLSNVSRRANEGEKVRIRAKENEHRIFKEKEKNFKRVSGAKKVVTEEA